MSRMETAAELASAGVGTLIGTVVNPAGLTLAKTVPVGRLDVFADPGLGASPVWHVFAIDQAGIVFGPDTGVLGDRRVRVDTAAIRPLGDGLAWAPGGFFTQDGQSDPYCARGALQRITGRLARAGLAAVVGHEMEFVLVSPEGAALPSQLWAQYGLAGVLEYEGFVREVFDAASGSGVAIEQFHPEYGVNQFEISLAPQQPVAAADQLILLRIIVARTARRHGMRVSLSPVPFAGAVGSGAHQHFSLTHDGAPVFSGGSGAGGMTALGESAVAGVLAGLPDAQAVLCGSVLSGLRMQPGHWAGAAVCWGTENREAAVRFLAGGPGNPRGANVEVKVVDPSANPYLASSAILGLALDGVERQLPLAPETVADPATLTEPPPLLTTDQGRALANLERSATMRAVLGQEIVAAVAAVRGYERDHYGALSPEELVARFRLAWSL